MATRTVTEHMEGYIGITEVSILLNVSVPTIRRHEHILTVYRTPGGHRRYKLDEVMAVAPEIEKIRKLPKRCRHTPLAPLARA